MFITGFIWLRCSRVRSVRRCLLIIVVNNLMLYWILAPEISSKWEKFWGEDEEKFQDLKMPLWNWTNMVVSRLRFLSCWLLMSHVTIKWEALWILTMSFLWKCMLNGPCSTTTSSVQWKWDPAALLDALNVPHAVTIFPIKTIQLCNFADVPSDDVSIWPISTHGNISARGFPGRNR